MKKFFIPPQTRCFIKALDEYIDIPDYADYPLGDPDLVTRLATFHLLYLASGHLELTILPSEYEADLEEIDYLMVSGKLSLTKVSLIRAKTAATKSSSFESVRIVASILRHETLSDGLIDNDQVLRFLETPQSFMDKLWNEHRPVVEYHAYCLKKRHPTPSLDSFYTH
jgi:hypothetical protein